MRVLLEAWQLSSAETRKDLKTVSIWPGQAEGPQQRRI